MNGQNLSKNRIVFIFRVCIDKDNSNSFTVIKLFNAMLTHIKNNGGNRWRADSIRVGHHSRNYVKLLELKYGAEVYYSAHGRINQEIDMKKENTNE